MPTTRLPFPANARRTVCRNLSAVAALTLAAIIGLPTPAPASLTAEARASAEAGSPEHDDAATVTLPDSLGRGHWL